MPIQLGNRGPGLRLGAARCVVALDASASDDAGRHARRHSDAGRTPLRAAPDIAPLAELLADVTRRNEELAAAAALWQDRAMQAEERLAQPEAGPIAGDGENAAVSAMETPTASERGRWRTPAGAPTTLRAWIRRLLGR